MKNVKPIKIDNTKLMINSPDKLGRHLNEVKSGCGPHKSAKDYRRKSKHPLRIEE